MDGFPPGRRSTRVDVRFLRDDGHLARLLGRLAGGALPPLPPAAAAALVTGVLLAAGLGAATGITLFAPVAALLLAGAASAHPHGGRHDPLAVPLLRGAEYLYLLALGTGGGVPGPLVFVLLVVVALHHCGTVCRARQGAGPPDRAARAALGWDGRMLLAAAGGALGWLPFAFGALTGYLAVLLAYGAVAGWTRTPVADLADTGDEPGGAGAPTT